mgnify:CR=1 FL=1|tara:strand:- start:148 stop:531 length:384 start_codon:yes stop_codon:yes gene_type:complete
MLFINKKEIKYFTLFTLFYLVSLQKGSLFGKDYLDFFKWNKPDHLSVVKPDIDTIFKFGRIYHGLKSINLDYSEEDFTKDLKKLGFTKKEVQYFESLDLVFFMDKYVKEIRILEKTIDPNKIVENLN